jgi:hypothetical protein
VFKLLPWDDFHLEMTFWSVPIFFEVSRDEVDRDKFVPWYLHSNKVTPKFNCLATWPIHRFMIDNKDLVTVEREMALDSNYLINASFVKAHVVVMLSLQTPNFSNQSGTRILLNKRSGVWLGLHQAHDSDLGIIKRNQIRVLDLSVNF